MKLLTLARDLQRRKAREKLSLFVAEGVRSVEELLRSGLTIRGALVSSKLAAAPRGESLRRRLAESGVEVAELPESVRAEGGFGSTGGYGGGGADSGSGPGRS